MSDKPKNPKPRFRVHRPRGNSWYSVEAALPLRDKNPNGGWVEITAFSHKTDAARYCELLNEAVNKFYTA